MVCAHATSFSTWSGWPPSSVCLQLNHSDGTDSRWGVVAYANTPADVISLATGQLNRAHITGSKYGETIFSNRRLCIGTSGCGNISASIDGVQLLPTGFTADPGVSIPSAGRVALGSGWHTATFDNLTVVQTPAASGISTSLFQCVTQCNGTQRFVGFVGGLLTMRVSQNISAVARFCTETLVPKVVEAAEVVVAELKAPSSASTTHKGGAGGFEVISSTTVVLKPDCSGADESGFVWTDLTEAVELLSGKSYVLATQNKPGWEFLGVSGSDMPGVSSDSADVTPIYTAGTAAQVNTGTAEWIESGGRGRMYGPLNAR